MDEKIKISLPKNTLELLKKDCTDFKITKENGQPNMNAFINTLIVNYYESFSASEESLHQELKEALSIVPEYYKDKAFEKVVKVFAKRSNYTNEKTSSTTFSFKPTKISENALLYVENVLLQSESISSFYRRMFISYAQKTKNEREKIIHKENFELLQKAIKQGVQVCLSLQKGGVMNKVSVYSVSPAKDELFNYVLLCENHHNTTIRLASLKSVALLPSPSHVPDENQILFDRQIACAAQYPMYSSDNEPIKVQLTDKGKKLFEKIYLYRPTPIQIEGDVYTFNCSANQLLYYFERFGDSALILSPKRLGIFMRNYYHFALKKYKTLYKGN
jgi:hypothetical protein